MCGTVLCTSTDGYDIRHKYMYAYMSTVLHMNMTDTFYVNMYVRMCVCINVCVYVFFGTAANEGTFGE